MSRLTLVLTGLLVAIGFAASSISMSTAVADDKPASKSEDKTVLSFEAKNVDGKTVNLSDYKGQVLLIVNTASKCGYTYQYESMQSVHQKFEAQGFKVLAFPCNDFGKQEQGSESEIKEFCKTKYNTTFPLFSKVTVKGDNKHPLYSFLTSKESNPKHGGDIGWNFTKFLVGRDGKVIGRFEPSVKPDDMKVLKAIEDALKVSKP